MSQPEYMGSGPIAPMPEPPGMGSQQPSPAHQPQSEPLSQKRGLIVAILIGVNILCLAAIVAVSGNPPKKKETAAAPSAAAQAGKKEGESAAAVKTAEPKAAEPKAAEPSAKAAADPEKEDAPAAAGGSGGQHATVTLPAGRSRGVLRVRPDAKSELVVMLPSGTKVEITSKKTVRMQIWYEIKTVDFDPPVTGWMHENVLKMD